MLYSCFRESLFYQAVTATTRANIPLALINIWWKTRVFLQGKTMNKSYLQMALDSQVDPLHRANHHLPARTKIINVIVTHGHSGED